MAVTPTTIAELNELAKDFFSNVYRQLHNPEVPLKAQFARLERVTFTGRKFIFGVKIATGGGAANVSANKSLPAADEGKYDQGEMNLVRTYTRMALDGLVIEVTKSREGSYRPALAETMADRLEAHDLEVNRQLYCAGDGKLALIAANANSQTQTLKDDYGVAGGGAGARHLNEGDQIAVYDPTGVTLRGRATVTAVNHDTNQVTLDTTLNCTADDFVTRSTSDTDNFTAGEAQGLLKSVAASGSLHNIPGSGKWVSVVSANGGTPRKLTDLLVVQTITEVRSKSRRTPNLAITRPGVTLKYSETFLPMRQIMGTGDVELKGGFKPVSALVHKGGSIPVLEDLDCPDGRLFLIDTDSFRMADLIGTEWFDGDGAQFTRVTDKDAIEGFIRKYWALATIQRNANALIADLEDVATIDRY